MTHKYEKLFSELSEEEKTAVNKEKEYFNDIMDAITDDNIKTILMKLIVQQSDLIRKIVLMDKVLHNLDDFIYKLTAQGELVNIIKIEIDSYFYKKSKDDKKNH